MTEPEDRKPELTDEELEQQQGSELPDREVMSVAPLGYEHPVPLDDVDLGRITDTQ